MATSLSAIPSSKLPITDNLNDLIQELAELLHAKIQETSEPPILLGIPTRGYILAQRIARQWAQKNAILPTVAQIDITFHRDDYGRHLPQAHSTSLIDSIEGRHIILIDDVFHTGRTARAALEAIHALGRPDFVRLAVLVDRGGHELPIRPDIAVRAISLPNDMKIKIKMKEIDSEDAIRFLSSTP
jgi:pyrimidine operon attenuation protein/uracil phosphoribosyltransferase